VGLNELEHLSDLLDSSDGTLSRLLLEVLNGGLGLSINGLDILDAGGDVSESLGIDGTSKDTSNDGLDLLGVLGVLGIGSSDKSEIGKLLHIQ